MDDQYGGRTDDDLFYDDFEPVDGEAIPTEEPQVEPVPEPAPEPEPEPARRPAPELVPVSQSSQASTTSEPPSSLAAGSSTMNKPLQPAKGLAQSRYADKPTPRPTPKPSSAPASSSQAPNPPPNAPTAPKERPARPSSQNAAVSAAPRSQSGANPRQKLTEAELVDKMERMKLLAAEKTRKFEKAEMDEKQHAEAYARGMEEARKRRVEEAERRRRGEDDRRKLEDERAKNRERKLKAMNMKEGGWVEGKEAIAVEEARRGFHGANGGIRGVKSRGLAGSRFSRDGEAPDVDRFLDDRYRSRGRGDRGRGGGGGRGGRGGSGRGSYDGSVSNLTTAKQAVPAAEEFPALPSEAPKKTDSTPQTGTSSKPTMAQAAVAAPLPLALPVLTGGKWDDEMEALDAINESRP